MNFLKRNKSLILLLLLAIFLAGLLAWQFANHHTLNAESNAKEAVENGQQLLVDLQDDKWFEENLIIEGEILEDGEVKFSGAIEDSANATDNKLALDSSEDNMQADDAYSRHDLGDDKSAIKPVDKPEQDNSDKPVVKAIDELDQSTAQISIIITNLGLNERVIKSVEQVGKNFTVSFTPYGQNSTKHSIQLSEEGYSVLAELPMESTVVREDAGRFKLSPINSDSENQRNFEVIDSIIPSAIGFISPVYEDFSGDDGKDLDKLLDMIRESDSTFIYRGESTAKVRKYAAVNGLDLVIPNMQIDTQPTSQDILAKLKALETIALEKGSAVGIAKPYPVTFQVLDEWKESLAEKNIKLVRIEQR